MLLSLNELEDILKEEGINIVPRKRITSLEDIEDFTSSFSPPYIIKGFTPHVSHKTEHGLIVKHVCNKESAVSNYRKLLSRAKTIYIEKEVEGREFYISFKKDILYGDVVAFGRGGIDIEIEKDISFRVLPLGKDGFIELISSTRYGNFYLTNKFRDVKENKEMMVKTLLSLYKAYKKGNFLELEINPLIVSSSHIWVVDARAILKPR